MTEHCVNNGTSKCQTTDATHLILGCDQFHANSTLGFTYTGKQADLMFHTTSDPDATIYTVRLCITNISNRKWHVLTYENPYNAKTISVVKVLEPHVKVELYAVKESDFLRRDERILFISIDYDEVMLGGKEIDNEELVRLWRTLESLRQEPEFADMTVNGVPAHRAVVAMASDLLDHAMSALPYIGFPHDDKLDCQIQVTPTEIQQTNGTEASVLEVQPMASIDASNAKLYDCKELVPKNTHVCAGGENEEIERIKLDGAASTNGLSKIDILKQKLGVKLVTFGECVSSRKVDVMAHLIEDLKDVMQELKIINHFEELELLDLKKPYPENFGFVIDVLTSELQLTAFLEYVYVGTVRIPIPHMGDSESTGNTQLMTMIDYLLQAAIYYNLTSLVHTLQEIILRSLICDKMVQHVLQLAKKFDLDEVKLEAIDFLRRGNNVPLFDDPSLYQFVISNPKYPSRALFTYKCSSVNKQPDKQTTFLFAGIPVYMITLYNPRTARLEVTVEAVDSAKNLPLNMSLTVSYLSAKGILCTGNLKARRSSTAILRDFPLHLSLVCTHQLPDPVTFDVVLEIENRRHKKCENKSLID